MNESDMLQWLEELVEIPPEEDAALNELPDSFIWCRPLTRMTALTDPSSLGLPAFRGAVFAGPAGNGKHTLARALLALGVGAGDRIGTLAWNSHRHFELYYAVSGTAAICHTINPRPPSSCSSNTMPNGRLKQSLILWITL